MLAWLRIRDWTHARSAELADLQRALFHRPLWHAVDVAFLPASTVTHFGAFQGTKIQSSIAGNVRWAPVVINTVNAPVSMLTEQLRS